MPRLENELIEQDVASTLLSPQEQEAERAQPEAEQSEYAVSGADLLNEAISEQENQLVLGDEGFQLAREARGEKEAEAQQPQERLRSERVPQEQEQPQEQPQAATPEQIAQVSQSLEHAVEQYQLNDTATASEFASDFVGAFGSTPHDANVDVRALGSTMAKAALSTVAIFEATRGDMSKLPPIPEESARRFAYELLSSYRIDPRTMPNVDPSHLARTVQGGLFNFLHTYYGQHGGKVSDLRQLNNPEAAEFYMQNFMKALGVEGKPDRQVALKFADACGKYLLGVVGKLQQAQERNAVSHQPRGRTSRGQRVPERFRDGMKGAKQPTFRTNADLFSGDAVRAAMSQKL